MRLEHHLVGGYVRYISPYIIIYYYVGCPIYAAYMLAGGETVERSCFWLRQLPLSIRMACRATSSHSQMSYNWHYMYTLHMRSAIIQH